MKNKADMQTMRSVAQNCNGYEAINTSMQSGIEGKSCTNCTNLKNGKCQINLFDNVLATLDEE